MALESPPYMVPESPCEISCANLNRIPILHKLVHCKRLLENEGMKPSARYLLPPTIP